MVQTDGLSILLTSRPHTTFTGLQQPRELHVVGFSQEDITRYVTQYFTDKKSPQRGAELCEQLAQNPGLHALSRVPLYVRLLCLLSHTHEPTTIARWNLAQLYTELMKQFFAYAATKRKGKSDASCSYPIS